MLKNKLLWLKRKRLWRLKNSHNSTMVCNSEFPLNQVIIGKNTYGPVNALIFSDKLKLSIGSYCSIAPNVNFIVGANHTINYISTFPYKVKVLGSTYEAVSKGDIVIEDDVWLGLNSVILSGVRIGQGAVIAAGAVVTKSVPPYAIAAGVPARVIKYRFEPSVIDYMLTLDYSKLTEDLIKTHVDDLYKEIDTMSLEEIEKLYAWFPKKGKR